MNQREQIVQAIAALDAQRALLGDAVVDTALAPLRQQLTALDAAESEQRKQITVLFADVSGFTAMSEQFDAEAVRDTMNALWARLDAAITAHGGTIDKHIGDAVMALFGAPTAREDDPERAIHAALAMQDALHIFNDLSPQMPPLQIRIGLNTGPVVLGQVATTGEYTAIGDTVNLASRLEHAAPVGGILISHDTYRHVRGIFEVQTLEPIQVKGKTKPVRVYVVQRAKPRAFRQATRGVEGVETRMIGRAAELQQLCDTLESAVEDHETRVVTVVGDAGVGKSRLLYEFTNWIELLPEQVWFFKGRATPELSRSPYALIRDLFVFRFAIQESDRVAMVRDKIEQGIAIVSDTDDGGRRQAHFIGQLLGFDFAASPYLRGALENPQQFHDQALAYLLEFLATMARHQPTVIFLEDIHWADDRSLDLVHSLAQAQPALQLLIVCLTRPTLFERRPSWGAGLAYHTRLDVRPLSKRQSRQLVEEILQKVDAVPADLRELIVSGAEGNPFYVEELIKMLIDDGVIVATADRWHVAPERLAGVRLPPTLTGVLQARLDGLPLPERVLLQRAAVVGRIFWDAAVAELNADPITELQSPNDELRQRLTALRGRELIFEREQSAFVASTEYIFKHALLRDVTYESVLKRLRISYHAQVAAWLITHSGERIGEYFGLIAEHYERAEDTERAVEYLLRAGDQARAIAAYQEAIEAYQRALILLKAQGTHERAARTLMKLGLTYHQAYDFEGSRRAYDEGFALWQQAGNVRLPIVLPAPHALRMTAWDPVTLDPAMAEDIGSMNVIEQLFSGLVEWNPELDIIPLVARSWQVEDDGRTYIFQLRDDARWSDGSTLTAEDFVYAWRRVLDSTTNSPTVELLFDIKGASAFAHGELADPEQLGVRALDAHTLRVELEEPAGYFLHLLTQCATYPIPRHVVETYGPAWTRLDTIVTNGSFQLLEWLPNQLMVFERNPHYFGHFNGNVQRVEVAMGHSSAERFELYETDRVDIVGLRSAEMDRARERHPEEYMSWPLLFTAIAGFDVIRPPFDDRRVRRAFVLAIDREMLAAVAHGGYEFPATGGFIPPGMPGHSPGIGLPYDPEHARQLMAEAGYPGGHGFPSITALIVPTQQPDTQHYLQQQWHQNLGVTIIWEPIEQALWENIVRAMYDTPREGEPPHIYWKGWVADYPDPDNFLRVGLPERWTRWHHDEFARLVERARRSIDQRERLDLYQQADRILIEEAAIVPLTYVRSHFMVKPWVKKYPTSPVREWFWKDVVIEPHL